METPSRDGEQFMYSFRYVCRRCIEVVRLPTVEAAGNEPRDVFVGVRRTR
jgi:hypothetical protein